MITQIEIKKLFPHPDNPRQEVGDVTELSASIKEKGVMQNLTAVKGGKGVPEGQDGYTVIIGHRRLEAAKQAGLDTVPCAIVEMTEKDQIATMLLENMQRSDLTVYEQAQGMQMMLDLGETQTSISEKTGLSAATVSRRIKIATLDKRKFKAAESRGGTIDDYLKCAEIKDKTARNKVLDEIGSGNFYHAYREAIRLQIKKEKMPIIKETMKSISAENDEDCYWRGLPTYETVFRCEIKDFDKSKLPKKLPEGNLVYTVAYDTFYLMLKHKKSETATGNKLSEKEKTVRKANGMLTRLFHEAYELRCNFVRNFSSGKKYEAVIKDWAFDILQKRITGKVTSERSGRVYHILTGEKTDIYYFDEKGFEKFQIEQPDSLTLAIMLNSCGEHQDKTAFNPGYGEEMPRASKSEWGLKYIYSWLEKVGYQMSTMERQLLDGTHPAYKGEKSE